MAATNAPESVKQMVLDPKEYAMLGGGFPICVEEVGVVATVQQCPAWDRFRIMM